MQVVVSSDVIRRIESLDALLRSRAQRGDVYAFVKALVKDGDRFGVVMSVAGTDATQWGKSWLECLDAILTEVNKPQSGTSTTASEPAWVHWMSQLDDSLGE